MRSKFLLLFFYVQQGNRIKEKIAYKQFPFRVNSGHPLFIGYGRTGEIPVGVTKQNLNRSEFSKRIDKSVKKVGALSFL